MDGPLVKIDMVAEREVTVTEKGRELIRRVPTTTVEPGGLLYYSLQISNVGGRPATHVEVRNPIPEGVVYIPMSASGKGSRILVSTDRGNTFMQERAGLLPETITDIQWVVQTLPAGGRRKLEFQVRAINRPVAALTRLRAAIYLWLLAMISR